MQVLATTRFDGPWTAHSILLGAGLLCYAAVVAAMLHAMVVLIQADRQSSFFSQAGKPQPVVLSLSMLDLAADSCARLATTDPRFCDAQTELLTARANLRKLGARTLELAKAGTANLLWAPPGAVLTDTDEAVAPGRPADMPQDENSITSAKWIAFDLPRVESVMASR